MIGAWSVKAWCVAGGVGLAGFGVASTTMSRYLTGT